MLKSSFSERHIGPRESDIKKMLDLISIQSLDDLISETIPHHIHLKSSMSLPDPMSESRFVEHIKHLGAKNKNYR